MGYRVSKEAFGRIIENALADLPAPFDEIMETIRVEVRDLPTRKMLQSVDLPAGSGLLGLYIGRPETDRSVMDSAILPDVIYLFQRHIESICSNEAELEEQVRITVLHEIGHHFGLDEENLDELGYG